MKYYLIAGERSGDLHGSNLMKALRRHDPEAVFRGMGGDYMKDAGLDLVIHYGDLAFMGLGGLIRNIRTISRTIRKCKADILEFKPDVIILIDFAGFNRQIAKFAKPRQLRIFYYISPKVWAWYQVRAVELKNNVDRMFCILPFEKEFFKSYGWDVDYVGSPVLDAIKAFQPDPDFPAKLGIRPNAPLVALLPGSRSGELKKMIPLMRAVIRSNPDWFFAIAAVRSLSRELYRTVEELPNAVLIFDQTYDLLSHAQAAVVTSGTATLETGLFKVPQVVVYRLSWIEYWLGRMVVDVKYISLVNLIAGKQVIRELIQGNATPKNVNQELSALLQEGEYRSSILSGYDQIYKTLDTGSASETTAQLMVGYLKAGD